MSYIRAERSDTGRNSILLACGNYRLLGRRSAIIPAAWYVATTHHTAELLAEEQLARQGIQVFNPKCRVSRITRGARVETSRPYLPGYIFPRFDVEEDGWKVINNSYGVKKLLDNGSAERPSRVSDVAMQLILDQCEGEYVRGDIVDRVIHKFIPLGSEVVITDGPFAGMRGPVKLSTHEKVRVLLGMFGRPLPVDLVPKQVELFRGREEVQAH